MKNAKNLIITVVLLSLIGTLGIYAWKKLFFQPKIFTAKVLRIIDGNNLVLSTEDTIDLAGVRILTKGVNYRKELVDNINSMLLGKQVRVKIICPQAKWQTYPELPIAEVYLEGGLLVNEQLLRTGMAFFDHGYYPKKDYYKNLEKYAKAKKLGIWKEKAKLKIIYISSERFWSMFYPNESEVKKINAKDKIEYYFEPPKIFFYRLPPTRENERE